jgi:proteic killer suppression protein
VIKTFKHKGLSELWSKGRTSKVAAALIARIMTRLEALDVAKKPEDMNVPGFNFHALRGYKPTRYTVHVNGPLAITFAFEKEDAIAVDLENYH